MSITIVTMLSYICSSKTSCFRVAVLRNSPMVELDRRRRLRNAPIPLQSLDDETPAAGGSTKDNIETEPQSETKAQESGDSINNSEKAPMDVDTPVTSSTPTASGDATSDVTGFRSMMQQERGRLESLSHSWEKLSWSEDSNLPEEGECCCLLTSHKHIA